jgi:predicted TPR repeat methyltransferase
MVTAPSQADLEKVGRAIERRVAIDPSLHDFVTAEPRTALALARYSIKLINSGDPAPACEMLEMALLLQPEEPVIWYSLGMAQAATGAHEGAVASYRRSLALDARQPQVQASLGFSAAQAQSYDEAADAYEQALALDPRLVHLRQDLGVVRIRQRRYADGVAELRRAVVAAGEGDAGLFANLAVALFQSGEVKEAAASYARARALDPAFTGAREYGAFVAFIDGLLSGGIEAGLAAYRGAAGVATVDRLGLFKAALAYLVGQGWSKETAEVARAWSDLAPDDPEPAFALQAATGETTVDRAPRDYIVSHFDSFADSFDQKLVGELGYHVPETLTRFLRDEIGVTGGLRILDLGCGTGLSGLPLRPLASRLVGIDLAPRMIEKARARGIYDDLAVGEVLDHLGAVAAGYDLIVAADLVIYFGDLAPLLQAAHRALAPGGLLALSAETVPGQGWALLPSGRFAHSEAYLDSLAAPLFRVRGRQATVVRFEGRRSRRDLSL